MRTLLYALGVAGVVALAFWAYDQGYATRAVEREVARLERDVAARERELAMLHAEWAYLNRPDRLHELAEMNFETLGLMALTPSHFASANEVAYPPPAPVWAASVGEVVEEVIDDVVVMNHVPGAEAVPRLIAPPALSDDGEQLP